MTALINTARQFAPDTVGRLAVMLIVLGLAMVPVWAVALAWRIASPRWGHGYAPEAARAAVTYGFDALGVDELVAFTAATNTKSRRVMAKLGMTHDEGGDFDHPNLPAGDPLRRHVLYRLRPPST